jgi:hypothetical protein
MNSHFVPPRTLSAAEVRRRDVTLTRAVCCVTRRRQNKTKRHLNHSSRSGVTVQGRTVPSPQPGAPKRLASAAAAKDG